MSAAAFAMRAYRQVENQGIAGDKLYALGLDGILEYLRRAEAALRNPAFIADLTRLINQGYWFFDE